MFCPAQSLYSWLYGDFLGNLVRDGCLKVVVGQLCVSESVHLFRNWFPNAGTKVFILMPHLRSNNVHVSTLILSHDGSKDRRHNVKQQSTHQAWFAYD